MGNIYNSNIYIQVSGTGKVCQHNNVIKYTRIVIIEHEVWELLGIPDYHGNIN